MDVVDNDSVYLSYLFQQTIKNMKNMMFMVFRTFYAKLGAIVDVEFFVFVVLEVLNRSRDSVCSVELLQPL